MIGPIAVTVLSFKFQLERLPVSAAGQSDLTSYAE